MEKAKANLKPYRQQKTQGLHIELHGMCEESDQISGGMLAKDERSDSLPWRRKHG